MNDYPNYIFKIILLGNSGVGKTNLLNCYKNDKKVNLLENKRTVGVEFYLKKLYINEDYIKVQIWDTSGQERYKTQICGSLYGTNGVFILYDIADEKSFSDVDEWINIVQKSCDKITIAIIGNKKDKNQRKIETEKGKEKAKKNNAAFFEISNLCIKDVNNVFKYMIDEIYMNVIHTNEDDEFESKLELKTNSKQEIINNECC